MFENIDSYPQKVGAHWLWGDYIECCCLNSADKFFTKSDLYDTIQENQDSNKDSYENESDLHPEEGQDLTSAKRDDRLMLQINERFDFIKIRSQLFPEKYPFQISLDGNEISIKDSLDPLAEYTPYLFLLLSSCLRYHDDRRYRDKLTKIFEQVSASTLKSLLGGNAEVYLFSSKSGSLPTTAWKKILWLSKQLNASLLAKEKEFSGNMAGEGGLDIVAWLQTGDYLCNRPLFFAQSTCSPEEWPNKVIESSHSRWNKILSFSNPSTNMMFIPHSYRDFEDDFPKHYNLADAVLFDRSRILKHFSETDILLNDPSVKGSMDQLIPA